MKPQSAKKKGKEFEKWFSDFIREVFPNAQPQIGSGSGLKKGDIANTGNYAFELKNQKKLRLLDAMKQAERESLGYQRWILVWHPPQQPMENSVAILPITDLKELLKIEKNSKSTEDILDKWQIKTNLEKAIYFLKKVVKNL